MLFSVPSVLGVLNRSQPSRFTEINQPAMTTRARADDSAEGFLRSTSPTDEPTNVSAGEVNTTLRQTSRFTNDLWLMVSVITFAAEIASAVVVAVKYHKSGDLWWFSLTVGFLILASLTMQIFSLRWFFEDGKAKGSCIYVWHLFQLGPLIRYWNTLRSSWRCRRDGCGPTKYLNFLIEWRDVTMLRLFQSFLLSAPQMVLQLYVMVTRTNLNSAVDLLTAISAGCSTLSLIWTLVTHSKVLREFRRASSSLSFTGLILQVLWRTCMITSRVVALVLFASHFTKWLFLAVGIHWLIMTLWLVCQRNRFCVDGRGKEHPFREKLFSAVIGFIYIFCFFNVREGVTRGRLVFFYSLALVENSLLVAMWYPNRTFQGMMVFTALLVVWGGFAFGVLSMILYYYFYHPSLPVQGMCVRKRKFDVDGRRGHSLVVCCCCFYKTQETAYAGCVRSKDEVVIKGVHRTTASPAFELEILPRVASRDLYREECEFGSRAEYVMHSTPRKPSARQPLGLGDVSDVVLTANSPTCSARDSISNYSLVTKSEVELEFDYAGHISQPLFCTVVSGKNDIEPKHKTSEKSNERFTPALCSETPASPVQSSATEKVENPEENGEATNKDEQEAEAPRINYGSLSFGHRYSLVSSDCISLSSESSRSSLDSIVYEDEGKSPVRVKVGNESEVALTPRTADEGIYSDDRCSSGVQRGSSHTLGVPSHNSVLSSPDDENLGYLEYLMDARSPPQVRTKTRTAESTSEKEDAAESESDWQTDASSDTGPLHCSLEEIQWEKDGAPRNVAVTQKRHTFDFSDLSASKRGNRRRRTRSQMRRPKRKEFDNFVVTHLKPGKYGSLRRSCEPLAKIQEDSEDVWPLPGVGAIPEAPSPRLSTPEPASGEPSRREGIVEASVSSEVPIDSSRVLGESRKNRDVDDTDSDRECPAPNEHEIPDDESSSSQGSPVSKVHVERAKAELAKRRRLKKFLSKGITPGKYSSVRCSYDRLPADEYGSENHNGDREQNRGDGSAHGPLPLPEVRPISRPTNDVNLSGSENILRILAATGRASDHYNGKLLENGLSSCCSNTQVEQNALACGKEVNRFSSPPDSCNGSAASPEKRHTYDFSRLSVEPSSPESVGPAEPLASPRSPVWVHQPLPFNRRDRRPHSAVLYVK